MKHSIANTNNELSLDIVCPSDPRWEAVVQHVSTRYRQAFFADLRQFMPAYLTLTDHNEIMSVCGFRHANTERLYLEQYLEDEAQILLSDAFKCDVKRDNLVEFGHLASFAQGLSTLHFYLIAQMLVERGLEWCIFTATESLHTMMARLGLEPQIIAQADKSKVPDAHTTWGAYYEHHPRVLAGNLVKGLERLSFVQERRRKLA